MPRSLPLGHVVADKSGFFLPADEAPTQKYAFLGRSGSGKSYGAMKLAELFLALGAQIIALDWVGVWWSLRVAKDGKGEGFPHLYIFGGEHADVPLEPTSGGLIADLVVDKNISVVLDLMHFRKAERTRFATAFAEQFFHRKKTRRSACHVFIEEAQAYLPQKVQGDDARMVGVFEDIGKVGRNYGIGNTLISQRPQAINKDVLNQAEVVLAFQTNGRHERKAISDWTSTNIEGDAAGRMINLLPGLPKGDAIIWSPQWLRTEQRIHIGARETYDASSTPTAAKARRIAPKLLAEGELEQLGESIKATIEKQRADDPAELRAQISALRKQIAKLEAVDKTTDRPALTDADRKLIEKLTKAFEDRNAAAFAFVKEIEERCLYLLNSTIATHKANAAEEAKTLVAEMDESLGRASVKKLLDKLSGLAPPSSVAKPFPMDPASRLRALASESATPNSAASLPAAPSMDTAPIAEGLTTPMQKILNALLFLREMKISDQPHKDRLAVVVGVPPTSGGYMNNLGKLKGMGLISYPVPGHAALLPAGEKLASRSGIPRTRQELLATIRARVSDPQWKIVEELVKVYPDRIHKSDLAEKVGAPATSGGYMNNLGKLKALGIIDYPMPGTAAASDIFSHLEA